MQKKKNNNQESHQYRAAIYARYSSAGQRDESIEGQIRECTEFAKRNGITVVKIYADRAISGRSTAKRLEFQKMIKDSEKGIFDAIICWKIDRFARNRYDSAIYKAKLKKNGCRLFYARETIPDGAEGIVLESVMEGFAEYYSANLSENVKRGNYESALECKTLGVRVLGYRTGSDGRFEINPEEAPAVRFIFEQYAARVPSVRICEELNNRGYKTSTGIPFGKCSVAPIIRNEKYIGVYTYKDEIRIEGGIPAIVDRETWDKCQAILAENRRAPRRSAGESVGKYILTGKLFCGECGSTMISGTGTSHTGRQYGYYQCSHIQNKKCKKHRVKKEWIENFVMDHLREIIMDDAFIEHIADAAIEYQNNALMEYRKDTTSELERRLKETKKARANIIAAIERGMMSDALEARYKALDEEVVSLEAAIEEYNQDIPTFTRKQIVDYFKDIVRKQTSNPQYDAYLIDTFLNACFLYDDGRLIICFNYTGEGNKVTISEVEEALADYEDTAGSPDCRGFTGTGDGSNLDALALPSLDNTNLTIFFIGFTVAVIVRTK